MSLKRVLLLGGTTEATALAHAIVLNDKIELTVSLAGRTTHPTSLPGKVRIGGFGGITGLQQFLLDEQIDIVIDATHPFAARMAKNSYYAAHQLNISHLKFLRPGWAKDPDDHWVMAGDPEIAADLASKLGKVIFVSIGRQEIGPFLALNDRYLFIRSIEPIPQLNDYRNIEALLARGPFSLEEECQLFEKMKIEVLVSKLSGGNSTYAKIEATRKLKLPVVMIERPTLPTGIKVVEKTNAVLHWLNEQLN